MHTADAKKEKEKKKCKMETRAGKDSHWRAKPEFNEAVSPSFPLISPSDQSSLFDQTTSRKGLRTPCSSSARRAMTPEMKGTIDLVTDRSPSSLLFQYLKFHRWNGRFEEWSVGRTRNLREAYRTSCNIRVHQRGNPRNRRSRSVT